jgi:hypothetical protein
MRMDRRLRGEGAELEAGAVAGGLAVAGGAVGAGGRRFELELDVVAAGLGAGREQGGGPTLGVGEEQAGVVGAVDPQGEADRGVGADPRVEVAKAEVAAQVVAELGVFEGNSQMGVVVEVEAEGAARAVVDLDGGEQQLAGLAAPGVAAAAAGAVAVVDLEAAIGVEPVLEETGRVCGGECGEGEAGGEGAAVGDRRQRRGAPLAAQLGGPRIIAAAAEDVKSR